MGTLPIATKTNAMVFSMQCAPQPRQRIDPPHSFSAAPLFRGRLLPVFGFFAGMQKGTPTRAPQVVMSTREGCFPEITCEELGALHRAKRAERLDAETIFLTCPALSEKAVRKLPNPVERSLLGPMVLMYLEQEEPIRRWAEEKVRQNPESPALYLHARWWDGVRDWHQAHKTAMIAYSECQDAENADDCTKRLRLAALRAAAALSKVALEERDARENAMFDLS